MTHTTQPQSPTSTSIPAGQPGSNDRRRSPRAYAQPRLVAITRDQALLEALGPAQANYGNGGFP